MAAYFNTANPDCLALLPDDVKNRSDLDLLASEAEAEVIAMYKREEPDYRNTALYDVQSVVTGNENLTTSTADPRVYLRYYQADADDLTSTDELTFLAAMRRAIAQLIRVRSVQEDLDLSIASETRGRRSVTYWRGINRLEGTIPRSVTNWLKPYDKRPPTYAI